MDDTFENDQDFDDSFADEFELLHYDIADHVAIITIDRPDALNALNADLLFELSAAVALAEADYNVKALILTGTGRAFVAGADIANLQKLSDAFSGREASLAGQELTNSLAALPFPTIAAINGFALGGGLELALACDIRVASKTARLGLPEVGLGLLPGYGGR
jgi:enoyl-CoA hydratase